MLSWTTEERISYFSFKKYLSSKNKSKSILRDDDNSSSVHCPYIDLNVRLLRSLLLFIEVRPQYNAI